MEQIKFAYKEAIGFGVEKTKKHFWYFAGIISIMFALTLASERAEVTLKETGYNNLYLLLIILFLWVLYIMIELGVTYISLKIHDKQETDYADLFSQFNKIFNYILALLLYGLIVVAGAVLLIVPGVIWAIKYQFFGYFIVDKNVGPLEALRSSAKITTGYKKKIFVFDLLLILIIIAGAIAFVVGLFFAIPVALMAMAFVYRKLSDEQSKEIPKKKTDENKENKEEEK